MKFDSLFEQLFKKFTQLDEMALGIYFKKPYTDPETGAEMPMRNKVGGQYNIDTPEEINSKKEQWQNSFKSYLMDRHSRNMFKERGSGMYSIGQLYDSITEVAPIDEDEFYSRVAEAVSNNFFPDGLNTARNWEEFRQEGVPVLRKTLQDIAKEYNAPFHTNDTNISHAVNNIVKGFSKKTAAEVYIHGDENYKDGSTEARGRKSKEQIEKEKGEGRFEESYLEEMPVQIKGKNIDFKRKWQDAIKSATVDKHSSIGSEHDRGSDTYHILDTAKHLSGAEKNEDVPVMSIEQATDMLTHIVYDKVYNEQGYSGAINLEKYRSELAHAIQDAISILENEHGIDFRVGNKAEFTARIIDNATKRAGIDTRTGADNTPKTWKSKDVSESVNEDDEEENDEDDEDEDSETDDDVAKKAYEHGLLSDEEEEPSEKEEEEEEIEERPSEEEEEESADALASKIEQSGIDIASKFMNEFERLFAEESDDEESDEESSENEEEDISAYKPDHRSNMEDEEERFSSWDKNWMSRDYDQE